jgi:pSer/pThr/pTyr-binding forkhead associated (FHA) protein
MRLRFRIRPPLAGGAPALERTVEVDAGRGAVSLGREAGSDVPLPFTTVSARHARLVRAADVWAVTDIGSANGTFVAGRRLRMGEPHVLRRGQVFQLADVDVVFEGAAVDHPDHPDQPAPSPETTATLARRLVSDLFGSHRPAETVRLRVIEGPDQGKELALSVVGHSYRVGRASGCDLVLLDDDVSREHAAFERLWSGVEVRDLGSKNGVELNGERIVEVARLRDGDVAVVGATALRLDDPEDRYLRQMQEEARRQGTTLVPAAYRDPPAPVASPSQSLPAPRRGVAPVAIAAVALAVLAGLSGLVLWFLVGN